MGFLLVIVLLSILRAKMINTYQSIIQEADVQWKFFRAELWWKYLDSENVWAPPPFTFLDLFERFVSRMKLERKHKAYCRRMQVNEDPNSLESQQHQQIQHQNEIRNEFLAKYKELLFREAEAASQYNNGMDRNKEEELEELAGCEA